MDQVESLLEEIEVLNKIIKQKSDEINAMCVCYIYNEIVFDFDKLVSIMKDGTTIKPAEDGKYIVYKRKV